MDIEAIISQITEAIQAKAPDVLAALAILVVGYIVAKLIRSIVAGAMKRAKFDETIIPFIRNLVYMLAMAFVVIAALGKLGVDTTSFAAIIAAAGLAIGLALQGSLGNFAAGVIMIVLRPFKVGDIITAAGETGKVQAITVFSTELCTPDNLKIIIPNSAVTGGNIINLTAHGIRRIDMVIGVGYSDDLKKAGDIILGILNAHPGVLKDPEPQVAVSELADSSVNFVVRPWVTCDDYWGVKFELLEQIKVALDENGLNIPFPQRDVHLHQVA